MKTTGFLPPAPVAFRPRSEERRVGKECRSRCDWSSDVCSSDLHRHGDEQKRRDEIVGGGVMNEDDRLPAAGAGRIQAWRNVWHAVPSTWGEVIIATGAMQS